MKNKSIAAVLCAVILMPLLVNAETITSNPTIGTTSSDVTTLQNLLGQMGYLYVKSTGYFGQATQAALKTFQQQSGLPTTGTLTPETKSSINAYAQFLGTSTSAQIAGNNAQTSAVSSLRLSTQIGYGAKGTQVTRLQTILHQLGYLKSAPTGYFGAQTKTAITRFQSLNKLALTSRVDTQTMYLLNVSGNAIASQLGLSLATTPSAGVSAGTQIPLTTYIPTADNTAMLPPVALPIVTTIPSTTPSTGGNNGGSSQSGGSNGGGGGGGTTSFPTTPSTPTPTPPTPTPVVLAPQLSLSAKPATITAGQNFALTWTSTSTISCTAAGNGWDSAQPTNRSLTISALTSTQVFTVTCLGPGGTISKSVTEKVNPAPTPPVGTTTPPVATTTPPVATTTPPVATSTTPTSPTGPTTPTPPITPTPPVTTPSPINYNGRARVGMNLMGNGTTYFGNQYPFLDHFKTAADWTAVGPGPSYTAFTLTPSQLDSNGWPKGYPPTAITLRTIIGMEPVTTPIPTHRYVLTYTGTGSIDFGGATKVSDVPGRIVFDYTSTENQLLVTLSSDSSSNPIKNIHVFRQDQEALFNSGEIFNPDFIAFESQWSALRFMQWERTIGSQIVNYSELPPITYFTWGDVPPLAVMVRLANETHTDMWYNIPAHASDDYIRQSVKYIHDNLDPNHKLYLEYSNEVWNWAYEETHYALTMGDNLWGTDANHDGYINSNDPAEHVGDGYEQFYGYRSAQMASIAKSVYGTDSARLRPVLATQFGYEHLEDSSFIGITKANVGTADQLFTDYAVAPYFDLNTDSSNVTTVEGWLNSGATGVTAAIASASKNIDDNDQYLTYQKGVANTHHLSLIAYEGGCCGDAVRLPSGDVNPMVAFFKTVAQDPRMVALYKKMLTDFNGAGGSLYAVFQDMGDIGQYGSWSIQSNLYSAPTPRLQGIKAYQSGP